MSRKHCELPESEKEKPEHNCLECKHIPCVNFYRKGTKHLEGGEIYVFRNSIKEKKYFPCQIGSLIYSLCQLMEPLSDFPSGTMFDLCIRDLKASAYLLLSCHYRSAIQLLRPIVENYVVGVYWDAKFVLANQNGKGLNDVERAYFHFLSGKYEIPIAEWYQVFPKDKRPRKKKLDFDFCLSWMVKKGFINNKFKHEISVFVGKLNKYLHPYGLKFTEREKSGCPSFVTYQESEHQQCTAYFQDVTSLLLDVLYAYISFYFPDKKDSKEINNAIGFPMVLKDLEKEFDTKLIFSKRLKSFLSQFKNPNKKKNSM